MGLLPATPDPLNPGAPLPHRRWRNASLAAGIVAVLAALVPPLSTLARHSTVGVTAQFALLAVVAPPLLVVGDPWRRRSGRLLTTLAERRRRHPGLARSLTVGAVYVALAVWWRTPGAVRWLAGHGPGVLVEAALLLGVGMAWWLELVDAPPLTPRAGPLRRAALAALAMWALWVDAYVMALSGTDWYPVFHHVAGHGLSAAADQQVAAALLWVAAAGAYIPVVFANAMGWLQGDDDPDRELHRLVRRERRHGPAPGATTTPPT